MAGEPTDDPTDDPTSKVDPALAARLEERGGGSEERPSPTVDDTLAVIVSLRRPADDDLLADLATRGLQVRSVIGDVVTGAVALDDVLRVTASADVVSLDGGGRLAPEADGPPLGDVVSPHDAVSPPTD